MTPETVGPHRAVFGESAFWSEADQAVWWVDLHGRAVLKTTDDGTTWVFKTPGFPANNPRAVLPGRDGKLIVALDDRLARFDPATGSFTAIDVDLPVPAGHVLNDAIVDPRGRLIIGTVRAAGGDDYLGRIIAVSPGGKTRILADDLCISNGLALSPGGNVLYYADSHRDVCSVWQADYDTDTGAIGPRKVFIARDQLTGRPDGATVDTAGGYWLAELETGRVLRFTEQGALDLTVQLPVAMPTRPCFGGRDNRTLFVTTAGPLSGIDDAISGSLYKVPVPFSGLLVPDCRL